MASSGGNKKRSSTSDLAYWKRAENGKFSETHRAKRIARHIKRMEKRTGRALSEKRLTELGALSVPKFPRPGFSKPVERVMFRENIKTDVSGFPLHIVRAAGVVLEMSPRASDAANCIQMLFPRLGYSHVILNPLTGRVTPVSGRAGS